MAQIREIKKRMVAVKNIQRITKTMQMIATARFTAALQRAKATQPYTEQIRRMVGEVAAAAGEVENGLLASPKVSPARELVLVITSDRGLCGAYNTNVLRLGLSRAKEIKNTGRELVLHTAGKKAMAFFKFQGVPADESFTFGDKPAYEDVERLASSYINAYLSGEYDRISVVSTKYISNARQSAEVMQLLPMRSMDEDDTATNEKSGPTVSYEFSPSAEALLDELIPATVKTALFQAFNDATVSEQIMRMIAMKAATENAGELRQGLGRKFNRARQTSITTELMEVIAGAASLE